ncbi:MAG: DUF1573 domain-containing protein [Phycisphaerae bacterium]|nr:DUF1573 domain-containing protein [Phycisphaerae bacterium]
MSIHRMRTIAAGMTLALLLLTPHAAGQSTADAAPAPPTSAIVLPAQLDLGAVVPAETTKGELWLVNPTDAPVTVRSAKGSCGCIGLKRFRPVTLAPNQAHLVSFTMLAPKADGLTKTKHVTFTVRGAPPIKVPVTITTDATAETLRVEPVAEPRVRTVPSRIAYKPLSPGTKVETEVWLINTSTEPLAFTGARSSCGCTTFVDAEPRTMAPGEATRFPIAASAPKKAGKKRTVDMLFSFEGMEPVRVPLAMSAAAAE